MYKILTTLLFILLFTNQSYAVDIGYGGLYTSGKISSQKSFPLFNRNKKVLTSKLKDVLKKINEQKKLPFRIVFDTNAEDMKHNIETNYSMAVIVTRDDVNNELFQTSIATIHKTIVNIGMVVVIYQVVEDPFNKSKKKNSIVFSLPLVGYSSDLQGSNTLTDSQIDEIFVNTATTTLEDYLSQRLEKISLEEINGIVKDTNDKSVTISIGASDGLELGQNVNFKDKNNLKGIVESLSSKEAIIKFENNLKPDKGVEVTGYNIKGLSDETYQVTNFKISSTKATKIFNSESLAPQVSQWFSNFLSDISGKVTLPAKTGGEWVENANKSSSAVFVKDEKEYIFELAPAKYSINLDLTGLSSKMIESNNINENWLYKVWLKVEIPEKKFSKEYDIAVSKSVLSGVQSFEESDEFYDLIYQLTAKIAKDNQL